MTYLPTIGLEVHAELVTKSKMFCGCKNAPHAQEPNTHICPVCMAHPGTLPVPNEVAIAMVLLFGQAVGASRAEYSEFDRKNYFYPDIPKAYQISQYAYPFLRGGELAGVALTRVHLEEDTARSQHEQGDFSVVDFNRAGVPLMELVTEPVIHDAVTAVTFARELQLLLRTLAISTAHMEKGEMRVEANISVSSDHTQLGTKVEVKNLNSFKSVEQAIAYEIDRQIRVLEVGETVAQETRGWDEVKGATFVQRTKETAKDYRYFPDPDIPKIDVGAHVAFSATALATRMPILPREKRLKYTYLGLPREQIEVIINDETMAKLYDALYHEIGDKRADLLVLGANYVTSDLVALMEAKAHSVEELSIPHFVELLEMLLAKEINSRIAKDLLPELFTASESPRAIATQRGLLQQSDTATLLPIVQHIIADNSAVVTEYRAGKIPALQFLVGQAMKATRGSADPMVLAALFQDEISK